MEIETITPEKCPAMSRLSRRSYPSRTSECGLVRVASPRKPLNACVMTLARHNYRVGRGVELTLFA